MHSLKSSHLGLALIACMLVAVVSIAVPALSVRAQPAAGYTGADAPFSANLALSRPATASSVESTHAASFAVDGNSGTRWSSQFSDPQWIYVDLGQSYAVNRVVLRWETAYARAYQVQVSNDAANWATIYSTNNSGGGVNDLAVAGSGRYVRMYGTRRGTPYGYSLFELEVYSGGNPAGTATPVPATATSTATAAAASPTPSATAQAATATGAASATPSPTATTRATATATSVSSSNVALGRPASVSSAYSTAYAGSYSFDGNSGTRWSSQFSDPQWTYVDLGQQLSIDRVRLSWESAYARAYQVQVSNDAVSWTTIYSTTAGDGAVDDLAVSGSGRYVRMYGTQRATAYGYSLWEFEVYGSAAPPATATPGPTPTGMPPTPTATASGNPTPVGGSGSWVLAFQDEFSQTSLDPGKWVTCYPWYNPATGCTNTGNNEAQWYMPANVSVSNGTLKLTALRQTVTGTNGQTYNYTSGMVSTGPSQGAPAKFAYQYGFIEARVKLPYGKGFWPAFWTLSADQSWPPEIDAMEAAGNQPTTISMNVHWNDTSGVHHQDQSFFTGPDFTAGWHTLGVSWDASSMTWYVDGVVRKSFTDTAGIPTKSQYILLNLAIDGNNLPDGSTPFPGIMEVDYVRAWHR